MDKKILKERLDDVKKQLRTNAKDVHFFDKLIDEALSLKGQMGVDAIACGFTQGDVVDTIEQDTYRIIAGKAASAYQVKGGLTIVANHNIGLGQLLNNLVADKEEASKLEGEEKENYETYLSALAYVLNVPMLAASDQDFMFKIANETIKYLQESIERMNEMPLQEETVEENAEFEASVKAMEDIKESIANEEN